MTELTKVEDALPDHSGHFLVVRYKYVNYEARLAYGWERFMSICHFNMPTGSYKGGWLDEWTNPVQEWCELPDFAVLLDEDQL